jgi:hypothetical protein
VKIAAIHLRPDVTQIVEGRIQKNIFHIQRIFTLPSIFPTLLTFQQDAINDYFQELKKQLKNGNAAVYIGISDDLVKKIDCAERDYVSPEVWDSVVNPWMTQILQVEKEEYHVITPLHFQRKNKSIITGIAIRSTYLDAIFTAATTANMNLQSLEPGCYALLRFLNQWDQEHCILEVWERATCLTGYSPIRGMFKINLSQGWSHFLTMENGSKELCQTIITHDYTAYNTYQLANTNIPIYLVSDKSRELVPLLQESQFAGRLRTSSPPAPFIQSTLSNEDLFAFGIPLGLALAPLHERMIAYADTNG